MTETTSSAVPFEDQLKDALNLKVSINTGNFQTLFEDLFVNLIKMQNEITRLNGELEKKASKKDVTDAVEQIQITVDADNRQIQNLQSSLNDLKEDVGSRFKRSILESKNYVNKIIEENQGLSKPEEKEENPFSSFKTAEKTVEKAIDEAEPVPVIKPTLVIGEEIVGSYRGSEETPHKSPVKEEQVKEKEEKEEPVKVEVKQTEEEEKPVKVVEKTAEVAQKPAKEDLKIEIPAKKEEKTKTSSRKSSRRTSSRKQEESQEINKEILKRFEQIDFNLRSNSADISMLMDKNTQFESSNKETSKEITAAQQEAAEANKSISEIKDTLLQLANRSNDQQKLIEHLAKKVKQSEADIEEQKRIMQQQNEMLGEQGKKLNEQLQSINDTKSRMSSVLSIPRFQPLQIKEEAENNKQPTPKAEPRKETPQAPKTPEEEEKEKKQETKPEPEPEQKKLVERTKSPEEKKPIERVKTPEQKRTEEEVQVQREIERVIKSPSESETVRKLAEQQKVLMNMIQKQNNEVDVSEIIKQVLEATRYEIELSGRQAVEKASANMRKIAEGFEKDLHVSAENIQGDMKKLDEKIYELNKKTVEDVNKQISNNSKETYDLKNQSDSLSKQIEQLGQKIESMSAVSQLGEKIEKIEVGSDGKVDLGPLLKQVGVLHTATKEIGKRLEFIEKTEKINPDAFKEVCETVNDIQQKFPGIDSSFVSLEMKIGSMGDRISEIKGFSRTEVDEKKFNQLRELIASIENELKSQRETISKLVKDTTNDRMEQNAMKQSIDKTSNDITLVIEKQAKTDDDQNALNNKIKKVIGLVQNINSDLSEQIRVVSTTVRANAQAIQNVKQEQHQTPVTIEVPQTPEKTTNDEAYRPNSIASNSSRSAGRQSRQSIASSERRPAIAEATRAAVSTEDIGTSPRIVREEKSALPKLKKDKEAKTRNVENSRIAIAESKRIEEIAQKVQALEASLNSSKASMDTIIKQCKTLSETKAEKDALQNLFDQFKSALSELNNRLGAVRRTINTKVETQELTQFRKEMLSLIQQKGETAAGTENIRCLLCGQIRKGVSGAGAGYTEAQSQAATQNTQSKYADDQNVNFSTGPVLSSSVADGTGEGAACLVYSKDGEMFKGRSFEKERIVPAEGPIVPNDLIPNGSLEI